MPLLDIARDADAAPSSGGLLRGWRKRALMTQEELAERAGLNVRTVRRLENGGLWQPRTRSIVLLAQALGLDGEERALLAAVTRGLPGEGEGPAGSGTATTVIVPRQLPADVAALAGREGELAALEGDRTAPVVSVEGMAGTGKTALAVHAAHRLAPGFPGGQLFVNLHGHARATLPVEPGAALARLLRALGVPGQDVPEHLDDRAALYRSVLAEREVLIVLDDAADEHQILPLLPAGPGCRVIVTSRRRLSGLADVANLPLDVLPAAAAIALFTRVAGPERVADVPDEVLAEVVERCGRLPLAVRVAAARLREHATWSVHHLLDRLAGDRLAELRAGRHDVAAALDLSYDRLSPGLRRAYRLLGTHPGGGDLGAGAAAGLLGTSARQAERLLDELLEVHLLRETAPGRYRLHGLVREHASRARPCPGD
ncbi:helix-turn-helix domain-containing protein [Nonomuraea sp. MG754425]|uniref:helix-turn-helix domain-containing protein n=1 Tax=Nonomuraea sp. MG754425 TaxID=2570319 RepID=UPI001EFFE6D0|nr:helix-turn-helix domain-containing protein [Nonomuraea sp. MG754425]